MQDLRQGNCMIYELRIRPTRDTTARIARVTVTVSTCVEIRKRREPAENWLSFVWVALNVLPARLFEGPAKIYAGIDSIPLSPQQ